MEVKIPWPFSTTADWLQKIPPAAKDVFHFGEVILTLLRFFDLKFRTTALDRDASKILFYIVAKFRVRVVCFRAQNPPTFQVFLVEQRLKIPFLT